MVRIIPPGGRKRSIGHRAAPDRRHGQVEDLASDGRGVVRLEDGRVVLVARVWPGETVTVQLGRGTSAELIGVVEPSPERRAPPCRHFAACGGCAWQMVTEDAQAGAKQQRAERVAQQLGVQPRSLWRSPQEWHYRNRAQLKTDGRRLGFMGRDGASLVDITECPVMNPGTAAALAQLRSALPQPRWRGRGNQLRTWHIDDQLPPRLDERLPFRQGNSAQNLRMRDWLGRRFSPGNGRKVLELFAGSGNFTEVLAAAGAEVLAVEVVAEALAQAQAQALAAVEWLAADLFSADGVAAVTARAQDCVDLVLDPPRAGFDQLAALVAALPTLERVLYISCDPATFTRDVAPLANQGWRCEELQPVDLFPQTPHLELLCELSRI